LVTVASLDGDFEREWKYENFRIENAKIFSLYDKTVLKNTFVIHKIQDFRKIVDKPEMVC